LRGAAGVCAIAVRLSIILNPAVVVGEAANNGKTTKKHWFQVFFSKK
jgi:hypothetical protein